MADQRYRRVGEDAPTAGVVDTPVDLYDGPSDGPTVAPREERALAPSERPATRPETEVEFHELVRLGHFVNEGTPVSIHELSVILYLLRPAKLESPRISYFVRTAGGDAIAQGRLNRPPRLGRLS